MADYSQFFPSGGEGADYSQFFPEPAAPIAATRREAPGSRPLPGLTERLVGTGKAGLLGMQMGGPVGAATMMTGEGLKQFGNVVDRAAYQAGGQVTDIGAKAGLPPEVSAGLGYLTNVSTQAIPTIAGGAVTKALGSPLLEAAGKRVMQSALKPPLSAVESGEATKAIDTMLKGGFNATPGGVAKMQNEISKLDKQVTQAVAQSPATVSQAYPLGEIYNTLQKFRNQVNPGADTKAIASAWDEFKSLFPTQIPVQQAQKLKQGTYATLAGKYGEQGSASTEAQKALARGLRVGIAEEVPEVVKPLAIESELMNAMELASRRAAIAGNRDPSGLAYLASHPVAAGGMLAERSQLLKSLIARGLYSGRENIPGILGYSAGMRLGILSGTSD